MFLFKALEEQQQELEGQHFSLIERSKALLSEGSAARSAVIEALAALKRAQQEAEQELRALAQERLRKSLKEAEARPLRSRVLR